MHRYLVSVVSIAALLGVSTPTLADRGFHRWDGHYRGYAPHHIHGGHTGVYLDIGPLWWPGYPAYYYPPYPASTVVVTPAPTTYVQQPAEGTGYWYYCASSQAYYPYVKTCPDGWMKVVPDTPAD